MPRKPTVASKRKSAWLSADDIALFRQFLEPNPEQNNHSRLVIGHVSFYSSELKSVHAILTQLGKIRDGHITKENLGTRSNLRYVNTLRNIGLVAEDGLAVTPVGKQVLKISPSPDINERSIAIDRIIFDGLFEQMLRLGKGDSPNRAVGFFLQILFRALAFLDAIPAAEHQRVITDDTLLLMLQSINSSGLEIPRLWRLDEKSKNDAIVAWQRAYESGDFPDSEPQDESLTAYRYIETLRSNRIQADVKYRVRAFLTAYLDRQEKSGENFLRVIGSTAKRILPPPLLPAIFTGGVESSDADTLASLDLTVATQAVDEEPPELPEKLPEAGPAQVSTICPLTAPAKTRTGTIRVLTRRFSRSAKVLGDRAEDCVYRQLTKLQEEGKITALVWRADAGETPGWDIDYDELPSGTKKRIEVKSALASAISTFDLTAKELKMALEFGPDYAVALVTDSGTAQPKVYYLWDLAKWFADNRLKREPEVWSVRLELS
jgi:hypothetical protein